MAVLLWTDILLPRLVSGMCYHVLTHFPSHSSAIEDQVEAEFEAFKAELKVLNQLKVVTSPHRATVVYKHWKLDLLDRKWEVHRCPQFVVWMGSDCMKVWETINMLSMISYDLSISGEEEAGEPCLSLWCNAQKTPPPLVALSDERCYAASLSGWSRELQLRPRRPLFAPHGATRNSGRPKRPREIHVEYYDNLWHVEYIRAHMTLHMTLHVS